MDPVVDLTRQLVARASVTPDDAGCQSLLATRLEAQGFEVTAMPFGEVDNLWATHGAGSPVVVLAGHTDVVPSGPAEQWRSPAFVPTQRGPLLFGRGTADMKGSLAAMVVATEQFLSVRPRHRGTLAYLLTSDEEGPAQDGTVKVVAALAQQGVNLDYCIVGEPSSSQVIGDVVRVGRRGSLNARLTLRGQQGHVAYPDLAVNPIHRFAPALAQLTSHEWDQGNVDFPPTSLQVSNISSGTGATNVIPGTLEVLFNIRFNTRQTTTGLQRQVEAVLQAHELDFELDWELSGEPFLTPPGELRSAVTDAIVSITGRAPIESTSGGTSDGRFIAPTGCQVVELGPVNESIHKIDEHVAIADLPVLARMYQAILTKLLGDAGG